MSAANALRAARAAGVKLKHGGAELVLEVTAAPPAALLELLSRHKAGIDNIAATQPSSAPEKPGSKPSAPSASSAAMPKFNPTNGFAAQPVRTMACDADGSGDGSAVTVRANLLEKHGETAADGADANLSGKTDASGWRARL